MTAVQTVTLRDARRDEVPLIVAMLVDDALGATREKFTDPLPQAYYAAFDAIYSPGNAYIGANYFYSFSSGPYATEEVETDGSGEVASVTYAGIGDDAYSSVTVKYVGGVYAGAVYTFTPAPKQGSYSEYQTQFDYAGAFVGETFFYDDVSGQSYAKEQLDYEAENSKGVGMKGSITGLKNQ